MSPRVYQGKPTIFPPHEVSESILGYLWRVVLANGTKRVKGVADYLVDRRALQPPWIVPSNLRMLCERLDPVFSSVDEIVQGHTCLPALMPFVSSKHVENLLDHVVNGKHIPGIAAIVGFAGNYVESRAVMALCTSCVEEDVTRFGFAYWRREHCIPGLGYCPHHGTPLVAGCGTCQLSHPNNRKAKLPQMQCWCGRPHKLSHAPVSAEDGAVLARLARLTLPLLQGAPRASNPEEIGGHYHMRVQALGFSQGTYISSKRFARAVAGRYSPVVLNRLNASLGKGRSWLEVTLGKRMPPIILGRNLLLLDMLGGAIPNAAELQKTKGYLTSLEERRDQGRKIQRTEFDEVRRDEVRDILRGYKLDNPDASRTRMLREMGRVAVWARTHDAAWYDELIPERPRSGGRWKGQSAELRRYEFDERTYVHVFQKQIELLSCEGTPKKITKSLLLRGAPCGNQVTKKALRFLPLTRKALRLCVESCSQYTYRRVRWLLDTLPKTEDRFHRVSAMTGLPLHVIDRLSFLPRPERRGR